MADLDPPSYATNRSGQLSPPDVSNREWLGRAGITDKLIEALSTLFAPIAALNGKLNRNDINADVLRRLDSYFGGMTRTPVASDARYWRAALVFYRGSGRFTMLASRGPGHFPDVDRVLTQRDSFDRMRTWTPEVIIKGPDGWDKGCDTGGRLSTGEIGMVTMRRKFNPATQRIDDYGPPGFYKLDDADLLTELEFPLGTTAPRVNFNYGPIMPFAPGGVNARQVWFYDGGNRLSRGIINGGTPQPIEFMLPTPAGAFIAEPAIQFLNAFPGDLRAYMICGNTKDPFTPYFSRSADGNAWENLVPLPFLLGRAPPYLYARKDKPGIHVLQARCSTPGLNQSMDQNFLGSMMEMPINAEQFYNTFGQQGWGGWRPTDAMTGWLHGMGGFNDDGPDGTIYGILTEGERPYSNDGGNTSNQGSPNRLVTYDNLPGEQMTPVAVHEMITADVGRFLTVNPRFDTWTRGRGRKLPGLYRAGPDGFGMKRVGSVGGGYSEAVSNGKGGYVWEIGRVEGDDSVNAIGIIAVVRGEELRKMRGGSMHLSLSALALQNFSEVSGLRMTVLSSSTDQLVSATDGGVPNQTIVSPARFFMPRKDFYRPFNFAYPVPLDSEMMVFRIQYVPTGVAGARDGVRFEHIAVTKGIIPRLDYAEPLDIGRARCAKLMWKSYDPDVDPGSLNYSSIYRARSASADADSAQISYIFDGEMDRVPDVVMISPVTGLAARIRDYTNNVDRDAQSIQTRKGCVVSNRNAVVKAGDLFGAEIVADASPWPTPIAAIT